MHKFGGVNCGVMSYKLVLLGEGRVGKTSLLLRFVQNKFSDQQQSTVQAAYLKKSVVLGDDRIDLAVWDTAGQERFHALGPIYYRDSDGAILVYDVTDHDSFVKVKRWVKELHTIVGRDIALCIAGNKVDLERQRTVTTEEAEEYTKSVGAVHSLTSAKSGRGVDEAFVGLAQRVHEKSQSKGQQRRKFIADPAKGAGGRRGVRVVGDNRTNEKKSGCC